MTTDSLPHKTKNQKMKSIIFSGVQPSGSIMLGNYLGAIKNWVQLQNESKDQCQSIFCIVDLHAITIKQDPEHLRKMTYELLALYIASGIDPNKSMLFAQSQVPQHAELAWILTCFTGMGELNRMTQFKDKSAKQKTIPAGLFSYPVLMAADILLYQTTLVPVGEDQKQHLELARDLAERMNSQYGPLFKIPGVFIPKVGARIMSLQDPTAKMSKSDPDANASVFLMDEDDAIRKKVKKAVTDSGSEIVYSDEKPGLKNLIQIQSAILGKDPTKIAEGYQGKQYGHLKIETAEIIVECLRPIRTRAKELISDKNHLNQILRLGAENARISAETTLKKVKSSVGFITA